MRRSQVAVLLVLPLVCAGALTALLVADSRDRTALRSTARGGARTTTDATTDLFAWTTSTTIATATTSTAPAPWAGPAASTIAPPRPTLQVGSTPTTQSMAATTPTTTTSTAPPSSSVPFDPCPRGNDRPRVTAASRSPSGTLFLGLASGAVGASVDDGDTWSWRCDALVVDGVRLSAGGLAARSETDLWAWGRLDGATTSDLVHSADRGRTWKRAAVADGIDVDGVRMVTATTAWLWGRRGEAPALFHTKAGSDTWWPAAGIEALPGPITTASFLDGERGWVRGTVAGQPTTPYLRATEDGGVTWQPLFTDRASGIVDVVRQAADAGCAIASSVVHCTADGGVTWQSSSLMAGGFSHILAVDEHVAVAAGTGGQVRFVVDGRVDRGTTITDTDGVTRAFAVDWGRYITINGDDGSVFTEADSGGFLEKHDLA